ncbi:hypothetical protein PQX77_021497 [Marasmius sp. AFHP31]|nr:hypothetical protein PQX77_021497 [Marasmius sp. AFHP31]
MPGKRKSKREEEDGTTKRPAKRVKRKGSLTPMHDMPIDTVYEIFSQCEPFDLLRLARTSKKLREMLMSRSSSSVWKRARQTLGVPDPTPGMSEPELAHLLFDKHCHWTLSRIMTPSLALRSVHLDSSDEDESEDEDFTSAFRHFSYRFLLPVAEDIIEDYHRLPKSEAELWLAERVKVYQRDKQLIKSWGEWHDGYGKKLAEDARLARVKRCQDIQDRMKELGWSHRVLDDYRFRGHKLVCQSKPLTERIWNNIKDKLEEVARGI